MAVQFHEAIGPGRIEARVRSLAAALKSTFNNRLPQVEFRTPLESQLSGGMVVFNIPGADLSDTLNTLYLRYRIGYAVFGGDITGIRMCPHLYNTMAEVDHTIESMADIVQTQEPRRMTARLAG